MKKIIFIFFLTLQLSYSYINIYPISFDKRIDGEGSYQEFSLFNQTDKTIFYRIYVEPDPENKDKSMDKWMIFYPKSFTLAPGEEKSLKLNIASYGDIPSGEYSAVLGIREIPLYEDEIKKKTNSINLYSDFKIVLNGYAGDIYPNLELNNIAIKETNDKIILIGNIKNIGERLGKYKIYLDNNFLGNLRINKNSSLNFEDYDFYYLKGRDYKKPKYLIIKDYNTKEEIKTIKLK